MMGHGTSKQDFAQAAAQQVFAVGKSVRMISKSCKIKVNIIYTINAVACEKDEISIEFW